MQQDFFESQAIEARLLGRDDVMALLGTPHVLRDCDLEEADLSDLDLMDWTFERCNLRRTNFASSRLEGARFLSCRAAFASWTRCDLGGVIFRLTDCNNADFRHSYVANLRFEGCKLTGANLTDGRGLGWSFEEVLLVGATLTGQSFRKAKLLRVDFSQADLSKCDFRGATLVGCSLREARLERALFDGADLREADLGGVAVADLRIFRGATFSMAQAADLLAGCGIKLG